MIVFSRRSNAVASGVDQFRSRMVKTDKVTIHRLNRPAFWLSGMLDCVGIHRQLMCRDWVAVIPVFLGQDLTEDFPAPC